MEGASSQFSATSQHLAATLDPMISIEGFAKRRYLRDRRDLGIMRRLGGLRQGYALASVEKLPTKGGLSRTQALKFEDHFVDPKPLTYIALAPCAPKPYSLKP